MPESLSAQLRRGGVTDHHIVGYVAHTQRDLVKTHSHLKASIYRALISIPLYHWGKLDAAIHVGKINAQVENPRTFQSR